MVETPPPPTAIDILSIPVKPPPGEQRIPDHTGFLKTETRTPKPASIKPKVEATAVSAPPVEATTTEAEPKKPLTAEQKAECMRRLGTSVPITTDPEVSAFVLRRDENGTLSLAAPPGITLDRGVDQVAHARRLEREIDGKPVSLVVLTIPGEKTGQREVVRFEVPNENPRVAAALEAVINRANRRGWAGLKRQIRTLAPLALTGILAASVGPMRGPAEAAVPSPSPDISGVQIPSPEGDTSFTTISAETPAGESAPSEAPAEVPVPDEKPTVLTIQKGSSRWDTIRNHLHNTYELTGPALEDATRTLVSEERSRSGVDETEALTDAPGTEITLPTSTQIQAVITALSGSVGDSTDVRDAVTRVARAGDPHDFTQGADQQAAGDMIDQINAKVAELRAAQGDTNAQ